MAEQKAHRDGSVRKVHGGAGYEDGLGRGPLPDFAVEEQRRIAASVLHRGHLQGTRNIGDLSAALSLGRMMSSPPHAETVLQAFKRTQL